jgi:hypothetical protein
MMLSFKTVFMLLLVVGLASCGRPESNSAGQAPAAPHGDQAQPALSNQQEPDASKAARAQDILGNVSDPKPDPVRTSVWFSIGEQGHSASELVELAVKRITKEEGNAPKPGARADVFFRTDSKDVLADVIVSWEIGKPCWTITIGRELQVLRYRKGVARG